MSALACAFCERVQGTVHMPDGRLFCGSCAKDNASAGQGRPPAKSWTEAYGSFVGLVVENRRRRARA